MHSNTGRKFFSQLQQFLICDLIFVSELGYMRFIEASKIFIFAFTQTGSLNKKTAPVSKLSI
jgi:hypothetical protein